MPRALGLAAGRSEAKPDAPKTQAFQYGGFSKHVGTLFQFFGVPFKGILVSLGIKGYPDFGKGPI